MEKIFYYRHTNNEIYQLKFKKVLINLEEEVRNIVALRYEVAYIQAEVAGLGLLEWVRLGLGNTLRPQNIFDSVEKAIACKNVNTLGCSKGSEDVFHVNFLDWKWDCSFLDFEDFSLPENIFSVIETNFFGQSAIRIKSYVWNGIEAVEKGNLGEYHPCGTHNDYGHLLYDVINNKPYMREEYCQGGYATAEECARNNSIKVHCFAC